MKVTVGVASVCGKLCCLFFLEQTEMLEINKRKYAEGYSRLGGGVV